jgi:hypothetical protein
MLEQRTTLQEKLRFYLLGVAIGLMIIGMMFMVRYMAHQAQQPSPPPQQQSP